MRAVGTVIRITHPDEVIVQIDETGERVESRVAHKLIEGGVQVEPGDPVILILRDAHRAKSTIIFRGRKAQVLRLADGNRREP